MRAYDVTNLYKAKFENRDRYRLTFFLIGWYDKGVVQWQKKSLKRCEKRCEIVKKGVKYEKKLLISMIKNGFLNFCIFQ